MKTKSFFATVALFGFVTTTAHAKNEVVTGGITLNCTIQGGNQAGGGGVEYATINAGYNIQRVTAEACANSNCNIGGGSTSASASEAIQTHYQTGMCYFTWTYTDGTTESQSLSAS